MTARGGRRCGDPNSMNASSMVPVAPEARLAGLAYLTIIVGSLFAQIAVFQPLTQGGSPAVIAETISANLPLWRLGLAVNLVALVANVPLGMILYGLFKQTQPSLAGTALAFILICATMEAVNLMFLYVPLVMGGDGVLAEALVEPERQALTLLAIRLHTVGFAFALLFFAGFCLLTGVMIVRSRVAPKVLGWLMGLAGVCYAVNTLAMIVSPPFWSSISPAVLLPCLAGEAALAIWLLVKGTKRPNVTLRGR